MKNYQKFADVYDQMGADRFSTQMVAYTMRILIRHRIKAVNILDLCCGTGTAIKMFYELGFNVSGLDGSDAMICRARNKLDGLATPLYCQRLPRFNIRPHNAPSKLCHYDLITCYYDSLNYLTEERQLYTAFRSVRRHLHPRAWFVFDMNTPEALRTIWGSNFWGGAKKEIAWIWRNEFDEERARGICKATFFVKEGKHWKRFDETHVEQGYDNRVLLHLLKDSGFAVRGFYRCLSFAAVTKTTARICVVAQRRD